MAKEDNSDCPPSLSWLGAHGKAGPCERKMRPEVDSEEERFRTLSWAMAELNRHPHSVHFTEIGVADKASLHTQ